MFKWKRKENITVDTARKNYQKHLRDLEKRREEYKIQLCDDIEYYSRRGHTSVITHNLVSYVGFMNKDYLNDLKKYFENKGFTTKFIEYGDGDGRLRISWGEE